MKLHPLHPASWVLDQLRDHYWQIIDLLAFTRSSTLVLAAHPSSEPVVVKAGFGSNHVLEALPVDERKAAYGFYWYQQMTPAERGLARADFRYERDLTRAGSGAPHVVPLLDEGSYDQFDWYTMPHYPGGNLRTLIDTEPRTTRIATCLPVLADAAEGLNELHQRGIVHRDVYQENILTSEGRGYVTDLGAARHSQSPRGPAHRGPEVHWPPEYQRDYANATAAADVFSLAVLTYRVLFADLPRLDGPAHQDGLPRALIDVVRAALAYAPASRPTMPDLRDALRAATHPRTKEDSDRIIHMT